MLHKVLYCQKVSKGEFTTESNLSKQVTTFLVNFMIRIEKRSLCEFYDPLYCANFSHIHSRVAQTVNLMSVAD